MAKYAKRLDKKWRCTLPVELREKLNINPGDTLMMATEGKHVTLKKTNTSSLSNKKIST